MTTVHKMTNNKPAWSFTTACTVGAIDGRLLAHSEGEAVTLAVAAHIAAYGVPRYVAIHPECDTAAMLCLTTDARGNIRRLEVAA